MLFETVAIGGTFEVIHLGHILLFDTAFRIGKKVIVGITSDSFVKKIYKKHKISKFSDRVKRVENYLRSKGVLERAEFIKLEDPYGPTITDPSIDALVVSEETLKVGLEINKIRFSKGYKHLVIVVVNMVLAKDDLPISTTRILNGFIDDKGFLLQKTI